MNDYMKEAEPEGWRDALQKLSGLRSFLEGWRLSESCARNGMKPEVERWIDGIAELFGTLAHIQRGAVPEGYDIAPTFRGYAKLGAGHYVLHNCPRTDEDHPSLVIAIATEEEKAGRQVGELRQSQPGLMIQPERIAVRIDFKSVTALDALEQQLRFLREDSFPDSLTAAAAPDQFRDAAADAPAPAEVPMPEAVDYVTRWGGACRDCADESGVCPGTGLPCGGQRKAIEYVIRALQYGVKHGYITDPLGAACRAAGEAAGYARGRAEADKLMQALRDIADPIAALERDLRPGYALDGTACVRMADNPETYRRMAREAIAALHGEVKP